MTLEKIYDCDCEWEKDPDVRIGQGYVLVNRCSVCDAKAVQTDVELQEMEISMAREIQISEEARKIAEESLISKGKLEG